MNKKQSITIPKFVWVILLILVVCIIFLVAVQIPFSQKIDKYNADHVSADSTINMYKDYLNRADEVKASIEEMKKECETKTQTLTMNADTTADDIRDMLNDLDYDLSSLSINERRPDPSGKVSATGDPLYVTTIKFSFTTTEKKLIETLKYFESESKGSYFVSKISVTEAEDKANTTTGETAKEGSKKPAASADTLYDATLEIQLYFFDMTKNQANASTAATATQSSVSSAA